VTRATDPGADPGARAADDDLVPVSVRLGEVVPPEDPEDWTKPLTWIAAAGMVLGPLAVLAWFAIKTPLAATESEPGTRIAAALLAAGAALTGATQQGRLRAGTATFAAALFGALVVVIIGLSAAGDRQSGIASPTVDHAVGVALAGLAGGLPAAGVAAVVARWRRRSARFVVAALPAGIVAAYVATLLLSG
jgi:hypothetical protein